MSGADAARESARAADGKFGEQPKPEPALSLVADVNDQWMTDFIIESSMTIDADRHAHEARDVRGTDVIAAMRERPERVVTMEGYLEKKGTSSTQARWVAQDIYARAVVLAGIRPGPMCHDCGRRWGYGRGCGTCTTAYGTPLPRPQAN